MNKPLMFNKYKLIFSPKLLKDINDLRIWDMDIRKALTDNAVKPWKEQNMDIPVEVSSEKLLTVEIKKKLPKLGAMENTPADQVPIVVKFFSPTSSWTWYATEGEEQENGD